MAEDRYMTSTGSGTLYMYCWGHDNEHIGRCISSFVATQRQNSTSQCIVVPDVAVIEHCAKTAQWRVLGLKHGASKELLCPVVGEHGDFVEFPTVTRSDLGTMHPFIYNYNDTVRTMAKERDTDINTSSTVMHLPSIPCTTHRTTK